MEGEGERDRLLDALDESDGVGEGDLIVLNDKVLMIMLVAMI